MWLTWIIVYESCSPWIETQQLLAWLKYSEFYINTQRTKNKKPSHTNLIPLSPKKPPSLTFIRHLLIGQIPLPFPDRLHHLGIAMFFSFWHVSLSFNWKKGGKTKYFLHSRMNECTNASVGRNLYEWTSWSHFRTHGLVQHSVVTGLDWLYVCRNRIGVRANRVWSVFKRV